MTRQLFVVLSFSPPSPLSSRELALLSTHPSTGLKPFFPNQVLGISARVTRIKTKLKRNLFPVKGNVRVRGAVATCGSVS